MRRHLVPHLFCCLLQLCCIVIYQSAQGHRIGLTERHTVCDHSYVLYTSLLDVKFIQSLFVLFHLVKV